MNVRRSPKAPTTKNTPGEYTNQRVYRGTSKKLYELQAKTLLMTGRQVDIVKLIDEVVTEKLERLERETQPI